MLLVHKGLDAGMGVRKGQELGGQRRGMTGYEVMRMKQEMTCHQITWHRDLICGMATCRGARAVASGGAGCYIE